MVTKKSIDYNDIFILVKKEESHLSKNLKAFLRTILHSQFMQTIEKYLNVSEKYLNVFFTDTVYPYTK